MADWINKLYPEDYQSEGKVIHIHKPGLKTALAVKEVQEKCVIAIGETSDNVTASIKDNALNIAVKDAAAQLNFNGEIYQVLQKKSDGTIGLDWVRAH